MLHCWGMKLIPFLAKLTKICGIKSINIELRINLLLLFKCNNTCTGNFCDFYQLFMYIIYNKEVDFTKLKNIHKCDRFCDLHK
jgi:hypothetical protein